MLVLDVSSSWTRVKKEFVKTMLNVSSPSMVDMSAFVSQVN